MTPNPDQDFDKGSIRPFFTINGLIVRIVRPLVFLFIPFLTYSQSIPEYSEINVIPPSPNVASLHKFVDIPVSHYTGTPDITIPIYELQMKQLSIPIALKYHASGLKVEEQASWVGTGWTLVAGGSISRTVKGLPDELAPFSGKKGLFYNTRLFTSGGAIDYTEVLDCTSSTSYVVSGDPVTTPDSLAQGVLDIEPDLYHFSFPGGSGKFSFAYDCKGGSCDPIKYTDDDITVVEHPFDGTSAFPTTNTLTDYKWVLRGPDGVTYTFEKSETTEVESVCGRQLSPYDNTIGSYQSAWHLTEISHMGEWIKFYYTVEYQTYDQRVSESNQIKISGAGPQNNLTFCKNETEVYAQRLTRIESSEGHNIHFDGIIDRLDSELTGNKRLEMVRIEKELEVNSVVTTTPVKFYKFNYDYFGTNTKLKLESVVPVKDTTSTSASLNGYLFEYYSTSLFPSRSSKNQDYWGFYNGASNTSLIPPYKDNNYHVNQTSTASRQPVLSYARAGSLEEITYPTGGTTTFTYELHEYYDANYKQTYTEEAEAVGTQETTTPFTVATNCSATLTVPIELPSATSYTQVRKWNGSFYVQHTLQSQPVGNRFQLDAGMYQLFAYHEGAGSVKISIEYEQEIAQDVEVGGLRVSKIESFDPVESKSVIRRFEYQNEALSRSSGLLFSPASLGGYETISVGGHLSGAACIDDLPVTHLNVNSYTQIPVAVYHGSHIGYSEVLEYNQGASAFSKEMGKVVHHFVNNKDGNLPSYPYVASDDYGFKNGKKSEEHYFENDEFGFKKIRSVYNQYNEFSLTGTIRGLNLKKTRNTYCYECVSSNFTYNSYFIQPKWHTLSKTIQSEYDDNGDSLSMVYDFEYEAVTSHNFPKSKTYTLSNGETRVEKFLRSTLDPALVTEFQLLQPNTPDSIVLEKRKVTYHGKIPDRFYRWDLDMAIWDWERSSTYGGISELREMIEDPDLALSNGDFKTSYIWGYNSSYPVVECADISYADLSSEVAAAIILTGYSSGLDGLDSLLMDVHKNSTPDWELWDTFNTNLKAALGGRQFSTYTYKNGVGRLSATDANNITQYYEYDDFNRLVRLRDNDENILKEFMYNYANQN